MPARSAVLEPFLARDDITIRRVDTYAMRVRKEATRFTVGEETVELVLLFTQRHLALNTLAALHAYVALGLSLDRVTEGSAASGSRRGVAKRSHFRTEASSSTTPTTRIRTRCMQRSFTWQTVRAIVAG